jgi:hypothetical protein
LTDEKNIALAFVKQNVSSDTAEMWNYIHTALSKMNDEALRFNAAREGREVFAEAAERTLRDSRYIAELVKLKGRLAPERNPAILDILSQEELYGILLKFEFVDERLAGFIVDRLAEGYLKKLVCEFDGYPGLYRYKIGLTAAEKITDKEFAAKYADEKHKSFKINESAGVFETMLKKTEDGAVLVKIAKNTNHDNICKILADKIKDTASLLDIAQNAKTADFFKYAMDINTDPEVLKTVACRPKDLAGFNGMSYDFDGNTRSRALKLLADMGNKNSVLYISENARSDTTQREARAMLQNM